MNTPHAVRHVKEEALRRLRDGQPAAAETACRALLPALPRDFDVLSTLALACVQLGRASEALPFFDRALALRPQATATRRNRALARLVAGDARGAIEDLDALLVGAPRDALLWSQRGDASSALGDADAATAAWRHALDVDAGCLPARAGLARSFDAAGRSADALREYEAIVRAQPANARAWYAVGAAHLATGNAAEALRALERACTLRADLADAWLGRAAALRALGRHTTAVDSCTRAHTLAPQRADVLLARADALASVGRAADALEDLDRVTTVEPANAAAWINRGALLATLGDREGAATSLDRALALAPADATAHLNRALLHEQARNYDAAGEHYRRVLALRPNDAEALTGAFGVARHHCAWDADAHLLGELAAALERGAAVAPFRVLAAFDSPRLHRLAAEARARQLRSPPALPSNVPTPGPRLRIGYLSADLHDHATALLAVGVFEHHDRGRFEVHAFSYGPDDGSSLRARTRAAFEHFHDVRALGDAALAERIRSVGIDVLVDLKGYTEGCRADVLAARPAPLVVSWLGYPGTLGAGVADYVLADRWVVTPAARAEIAEAVAYLPHSYQPNDRARHRPRTSPSRTAAGLPDDAIVFGCFNAAYKIAPQTFELWCAILRDSPGSVLWLLSGGSRTDANLRAAAQSHGIAGARVRFAPRLAPEAHLDRLQLVDVALDTLPYNAHTTASDALWAGVPLLTLSGQSFPSRVAGSLLRAAGLPELVFDSSDALREAAIALALDPRRRESLRARLRSARDGAPLFDTAAFTRALERAYAHVVARHRDGQPPADFDVAGDEPPSHA